MLYIVMNIHEFPVDNAPILIKPLSTYEVETVRIWVNPDIAVRSTKISSDYSNKAVQFPPLASPPNEN